MKLLECIPNFSEGRDMKVIAEIASAIGDVVDAHIIGIDPGRDANRTVITIIGNPSAVCEAAFRAAENAARLIDMSIHHGVHPRFGAADVMPLVPYRGMTMEEAVSCARKLGRRIGDELGIPVYLYENAATFENRRSLSECRRGGNEGLQAKMEGPAWKPDFGPHVYTDRVAKTGATAVGARKVLLAYNVNLNTKSADMAREIAEEVRESGSIKRMDEKTRVTEGIREGVTGAPGRLPFVRAIGWYIHEYHKAQVSMNLTDTDVTPLHTAFDEVCRIAHEKGVRVTGSELVGMTPLKNIADAGRHYLKKQNMTVDIPESELVDAAVEYLGLSDAVPFIPNDKIIEYRLTRLFE